MEELISIMMEIRNELVDLNLKMDSLSGFGTETISDIVSAVRDVNVGVGRLTDRVENVNNEVGRLTDAVESIKGPIGYDLTDIYNQLNSIDMEIACK